jgi:5-hydroxyisourate hydrolase-like protein (transthyretin family)
MLPATFAAPSYSLSVSPTYIQEGLDTNITLNLGANANQTYTFKINVTSSANIPFLYNLTVTTDETGLGSNKTTFWKDFPSPANTNRTGIYRIAVNDTLATKNFTVGLTDKTRYLRSEYVNIRATGYSPNEPVLVDLKFGTSSVPDFPTGPRNASSSGTVSFSWQVPANAPLGVYTLGITNGTEGGLVKTPADIQSFTVEGTCELQTVNLAGQPLSNITVEVYSATNGSFLSLRQDSNATGWTKFVLNEGEYVFKAFWKDVEVGITPSKNVSGNVVFPLIVRLSHLKLTVKDEGGTPIPWVDLSVSYNYTTRTMQKVPESGSFTTNLNGEVILENTFTNINYTVSARRYGFLFNSTTIKNLPPQPWNDIPITVPTYSLTVQVRDSKNEPAAGLDVSLYEWSSGTSEPTKSRTTNSNGNVTFSLTFGKYILKLFKDTTFLNDATVDLVSNPLYLTVHSDVYNVDLHVVVVDYFGQPMPNVSVEFKREVDSSYETAGTQTTGADGVARFGDVVGGNSLIIVSQAGRQSQTRYLYLTGLTSEVVFKMDAYVSIFGYALETSHFVTVILLVILIVAFILASAYKKLPHSLLKRKK